MSRLHPDGFGGVAGVLLRAREEGPGPCRSAAMTRRVLGLCVLLASLDATFAQESSSTLPDRIPAFEFDPAWPKQLPNNWILGNIAGVHADSKDQIWVLHR